MLPECISLAYFAWGGLLAGPWAFPTQESATSAARPWESLAKGFGHHISGRATSPVSLCQIRLLLGV